jgi:glycosyltransferase involved in cell wall biosynthesis
MVILSHPTGNANVRHAAEGLREAGLLSEFWTCLAPTEKSAVMRLLPGGVRAQFLRRQLSPELTPFVRTRPWCELGRFVASRLKISSLTRHEVGLCSVDGVYRDLDRAVAARIRRQPAGLKAVYNFEDGSLETFRAAQALGLKRIYDLPIAYWRAGRKIFLEEAEREPEWAATLDGLSDSADKLARKDEEIRLADCVLVASSFTKATLELAPDAPPAVHVVPYGAPVSAAAPVNEKLTGPLRVLFVGSLGQRKGTSYLLRACERLAAVKLTLIGNRGAGECAPLDAALRRHRWISSCPHSEVLGEMRRHDVLVFPSLFEGFGLVMLEAMSQGMTVITTPHTGGPDVLTDGVDGFIVPIRSEEAIAERLEILASDPERLRAMKDAAARTAATLSWAAYRTETARIVSQSVLEQIRC